MRNSHILRYKVPFVIVIEKKSQFREITYKVAIMRNKVVITRHKVATVRFKIHSYNKKAAIMKNSYIVRHKVSIVRYKAAIMTNYENKSQF